MDDQAQKELLLEYGDLVKFSLAGLLRDYELETWTGELKKGKQMFYGPQIAAYCQQPWENVNYSSCHDGETLFDQVSQLSSELLIARVSWSTACSFCYVKTTMKCGFMLHSNLKWSRSCDSTMTGDDWLSYTCYLDLATWDQIQAWMEVLCLTLSTQLQTLCPCVKNGQKGQ